MRIPRPGRVWYNHASKSVIRQEGDACRIMILMNTWCILTVLQFSWPEDPPCSVLSRKTVTLKEIVDCDPTVLFDTSSGRVVLSGNYSEKQYILELAYINSVQCNLS